MDSYKIVSEAISGDALLNIAQKNHKLSDQAETMMSVTSVHFSKIAKKIKKMEIPDEQKQKLLDKTRKQRNDIMTKFRNKMTHHWNITLNAKKKFRKLTGKSVPRYRKAYPNAADIIGNKLGHKLTSRKIKNLTLKVLKSKAR